MVQYSSMSAIDDSRLKAKQKWLDRQSQVFCETFISMAGAVAISSKKSANSRFNDHWR